MSEGLELSEGLRLEMGWELTTERVVELEEDLDVWGLFVDA